MRISVYPCAVLGQIKQTARNIRDKIYEIGDTYGIIGPDTIYDENYYDKRREDPWRSDARTVSEVLYNEFEPTSVIDFGCAIGGHLEWFHEQGIEVQGVEGNSKAFEYALIPETKLEKHDLRETYECTKQWNLALCIEVAEHIPERYSDQLVETLTGSSETIFFTAATPKQGGTHHVNLHEEQYWEKKFEVNGYERNTSVERRIKSSLNVKKSTWVSENMFVFRKSK